MYTTLTFITEVMHLATYICTTTLNNLKMNVTAYVKIVTTCCNRPSLIHSVVAEIYTRMVPMMHFNS